MVADTLVYHPTVTHYLKYVATTVGRDKFLRTIQYFSRFYSWYLLRTNGTPAEIAPYNAAKKQLGLIRKSLRLGKFVEHFKAAAQAYDASTGPGSNLDAFLRYMAIGRQLGYAGYMVWDNLTFLDVAGIVKSDAAKQAQINAWRCWFFGLSCNIIAGFYQRWTLKTKEKQLDKKEGEGVVESKRLERERAAVNLQLISDVCDLTVPAIGLSWDFGRLDEGIVGLAGTLSSLIGVYSVWQKTA